MKRFLPKLSRRGKIIRNLAVAALLVLAVWISNDFSPMPTETMAFRRMERQHLLPRSRIVLHIKERMEREGEGAVGDAHNSTPQFVGLGDGYAVCGAIHPFSSHATMLYYWDLTQQEQPIKLIPMVAFVREWRGGIERRNHHNCVGIAVPELPEGAVTVEMTLVEEGVTYHDWGTWEEPGCWFFGFQSQKSGYSSGWQQGLPYELVAYDGAGRVLARQEGNVPKR